MRVHQSLYNYVDIRQTSKQIDMWGYLFAFMKSSAIYTAD